MSHVAFTPDPVTKVSMRLMPRASVLVLLACAAFGLSYLAEHEQIKLGAAIVGTSLCCLMLISAIVALRFRLASRRGQRAVADLVAHDAAACFVADDVGEIWYSNGAATARFSDLPKTVEAALSTVVSSPTGLVTRLYLKARQLGAAREDVVTREAHLRLSCHRLRQGGAIWRLEDLPPAKAESGLSGAEALPVLVVGRQDTVLFMNDAARQFFGERVKTLDRVVPNLPLKLDRLQEVNTESGSVACVITELCLGAGRRELAFVPTQENIVEFPESMRFFDELPVPLLKLAPDGVVTEANKMACDLLGRRDLIGESLGVLLEGLGRSIKDWLHDTILGRVSRQTEFLKVRSNDFETFVQVTLKAAREGSEHVLVAVLSDATELKTLEAQFVQSQKMQAIGQLAGGVAHDFNNLLTAITGHCDLLMHKRAETDPDFLDLEQINQNANRAAALVSQLLAFSRKQTLRPETIDVQETLSDLTHLLNRLVGEKVQLEFEHEADNQTIRADKRQIEQVVMNLVVNARDAMQESGVVTIRTAGLTLDAPLMRDRAEVPPGSYVSIKVIDQGTGIPADKLQKIFEPFFTTKRTGEGTGLGLSTAYGIVKQTGGFIFADSKVGKGSCFTLLLPTQEAAEQVPAPDAGIAEAERMEMPDSTILLVEDEAPVRAFASRALKLKGFTVLEASSGEEALDILKDETLHVDAFVTDVIMPGLKGPEWVIEARKLRRDVNVVFVSGYAEDVFNDNGFEIPCSTFLQKPFSLGELADVVQAAVSQPFPVNQ
ncbi:PAS domain-containing hybrid sensor histidine kinase/response regulator [Lentibacter sp. XHP0401]|uniref:PAS domain-containing hybrid sensor histidine kinase/response regulator n=1 Tax=Lentibacter sp. XHP0401 TaxID=2984334 RepID=UPI0021E8EE78|nr:PAS domain-containing hybrid sensor histidine kinase/response regulator [Lentibacter sp. XHP0401]MCV2891976.1 ATP-binding protein [Lentibacter sp. XHP0401]